MQMAVVKLINAKHFQATITNTSNHSRITKQFTPTWITKTLNQITLVSAPKEEKHHVQTPEKHELNSEKLEAH